MNCHQYVKNILSDESLVNLLPDRKVFKIKAHEKRQVPYVTYFFYDEAGSLFSEGREVRTRLYLQIDINSTGDFTEIEKAIRKIARENDWNKGAIYEDIDPDTNLMFKCMRFSFDLNTEEV